MLFAVTGSTTILALFYSISAGNLILTAGFIYQTIQFLQ